MVVFQSTVGGVDIMRWIQFVMVLSVASLASTALGQGSKKLELVLKNISLGSRSNSPTVVELKFIYKGSRILRGPLELKFSSEGRRLGSLQTNEVVIAKGTQAFRYVIPPMELETSITPNKWINTEVVLQSADGRIRLGAHQMFASSRDDRVLAVGVVGRVARQGSYGELVRSVHLDRYKPSRAGKKIVGYPTYLMADKMPTESIGLCVWDVLVMLPEGFAVIGDKKLKAIADWVRAGGSLCVVGGPALEPRHVTFLNGLAKGGGRSRVNLTPSGELALEPGVPDVAFAHWRSVLGRLIVLPKAASDKAFYQSEAWRAGIAFLWKVRYGQARRIATSGKWSESLQEKGSLLSYIESGNSYEFYDESIDEMAEHDSELDYTALPMEEGSMLEATLRPQGVRVIPFFMIFLILFAFVLAIGPGDYFILGKLRKRKYTWILFPTLAVVFTVATVIIANWYMGREDHRHAIVIVDVDGSGTPVRQSRIELVFTATNRILETSVEKGLFCVLDADRLNLNQHNEYYGGYDEEDEFDAAVPHYVGRVPTGYAVQRQFKQWTMQLSRQTGLGSSVPSIMKPLPWSKVDIESLETMDKKRIIELFGPEFRGGVWVLHNGKITIVRAEAGVPSPRRAALRKFIRELSDRKRVGLFSVISQVSPTGGDSLEDLAMTDSSDSRQWLVVAVQMSGNDVVVQRRLCFGGE
jgi:hypothetical protein